MGSAKSGCEALDCAAGPLAGSRLGPCAGPLFTKETSTLVGQACLGVASSCVRYGRFTSTSLCRRAMGSCGSVHAEANGRLDEGVARDSNPHKGFGREDFGRKKVSSKNVERESSRSLRVGCGACAPA